MANFRKQAILDADWYSSDTFAEDCDVTLKIIREGWKVVYEPDAIAWTEAPEKLTHLLKQRYRWTRGILQSIRKHKDLFFNPTINFGATTVMWLMVFESLIWPLMNVFANLYFLIIALTFDVAYYLLFWWLSLTILDFAAACRRAAEAAASLPAARAALRSAQERLGATRRADGGGAIHQGRRHATPAGVRG